MRVAEGFGGALLANPGNDVPGPVNTRTQACSAESSNLLTKGTLEPEGGSEQWTNREVAGGHRALGGIPGRKSCCPASKYFQPHRPGPRLPVRPVDREARVRFPHGHGLEPNAVAVNVRLQFLAEIAGDVLSRWVQLVKRGEVVQKAVVQALDDRLYRPAEVDEIHQQADRVQFLSFHRHPHLVVVAVDVFAFALVMT